MTDLLFSPQEYQEYAQEKQIFESAVRQTQLLVGTLGNLQSLRVVQWQNEALKREIETVKQKLWRYALSAMRLQRQYHFPAFIYMHIDGPPGYQDLPLYRLPPNK